MNGHNWHPMYKHMFTRVCECVSVCIYVNTFHAHTPTPTRAHTCTHIHTHTHTHSLHVDGACRYTHGLEVAHNYKHLGRNIGTCYSVYMHTHDRKSHLTHARAHKHHKIHIGTNGGFLFIRFNSGLGKKNLPQEDRYVTYTNTHTHTHTDTSMTSGYDNNA